MTPEQRQAIKDLWAEFRFGLLTESEFAQQIATMLDGVFVNDEVVEA